MARPIVSEQWSQVAVTALLCLLEQDVFVREDHLGEVTDTVYALRHLAFRWQLDWDRILAEVRSRFEHEMGQEE